MKNIYTFAKGKQYKTKYMAKSEKRERFEKVASKRVQRVLDTLELIQNCSNRNNYEYDQSDVDRMFSEITKALKDAQAVYAKELNKTKRQDFTF
jgi:DNA-binding transcriptional regulator GbsR (MarR family)